MNRKELYGKGYGYVITRRLLPGGKGLRVRVKAYEGLPSKYKTPVEDVYRDYVSVAEGDYKFSQIIEQYQKHISS